MITGFNTDIEFEGTVYHVQTEDKGVESPLILTLVYSGGAILASKRELYDDLIEQGFDELVLAERLGRQHKLICAAINAGRIQELKEMSRRDAEARAAQTVQSPPRVQAATPEPFVQNDQQFESPELVAAPDAVIDREREAVSETEQETNSDQTGEHFPTDFATEENEPLPSPEQVNEQPEESQHEAQHQVFERPSTRSEGGYAGVFDKVNLTREEFANDRASLEILNERQYKAGDAGYRGARVC